jgi:preprotein translocase subunit SecG
MRNILLEVTAPTWLPEWAWNTLSLGLLSLMSLASITMVLLVLMQQGTNRNIGAIGGQSDSFFGKNKARTIEGKLKRWTIINAMILAITSIMFFLVFMALRIE